ncbi:MAG: ParB/RepB/Spo0J family partition protein [Deltaproteobacteria bacterium]|jgi:ParB family chromosome partitioning protein|nr:ParB/RepB/Spo0J family partition protein [Deltaproteobacteria bacterium]
MSKKLFIKDDPLSFLGGNEAVTLSIDEIVVEEQVRKEFDEETIKELAESIKSVGLINPPVVRREKGSYIILDGERRLRACKLLGKESILCSVMEIKEEDVPGAQIIANVHRKDLTDVELYYGLKLYQDKGLSIRDIATMTGMKRARVEELLKARNFSDKLKDLEPGEEGNKKFRKLAELEGIADPEKKAAAQANVDNLSRSDIKKIKNKSKPRNTNKNKGNKGVSEIRTHEKGGENSESGKGNQIPGAPPYEQMRNLMPGETSKAVIDDFYGKTPGTGNQTPGLDEIIKEFNSLTENIQIKNVGSQAISIWASEEQTLKNIIGSLHVIFGKGKKC